MTETLLSAHDLRVHFPVKSGVLRAVDGVSFQLQGGETLGIVGESGCGKSTLGRALLQLLQPTSGTVKFENEELTSLWDRRFGSRRWRWKPRLRELRRNMQMIFQDPYASLSPRMTVEDTLSEPLEVFGWRRREERDARVKEMMERVGLDPSLRDRYPHEFSGGQRQRIGIARALMLSPSLVIADEPISALDVSIQAQILNLLASLRRDLNLTMIFISHDLKAVRHISDRIAVMYLGKIVEIGSAEAIYKSPSHPYTKALLAAAPTADPRIERARSHVRLSGDVPSAVHPPSGCSFHPRCLERLASCSFAEPKLTDVAGRQVSCLLFPPQPGT